MAAAPSEVGSQWYYLTTSGSPEGPVATPAFLLLFENGLVDGLTKVSHDKAVPEAEWVTLAEHQVLRAAVRGAAGDPEDVSDRDGQIGDALGSGDVYDDEARNADRLRGRTPRIINNDPEEHREAAESDPGEAATNRHPNIDGSAEQTEDGKSLRPNVDLAVSRERKRQSRKRAREAKRLRKQTNTSVYVTGVPKDATEKDLAKHFAKCGILQPHPDTGCPRVKIYVDDSGHRKGDALITYAMAPSVDNALTILDGAPLYPGGEPIRVARASFEHKKSDQNKNCEGDVAKRQRADSEADERRRRGLRSKALVTEALSWAEEGQEVSKAQQIVILKNVFDPRNVDYELVKEDMEEGCAACGTVLKVTVFERNAEGVVAVKFAALDACVKCIEVMTGRWYDGRKLSAEFYDGTTDYRYKETEEDRLKRERKWQEWLEDGRDVQSGAVENDREDNTKQLNMNKAN